MKLVHKSLNQIRLKLSLTGLSNKLLLLKNHQDLSESEQAELSQLFQQSPLLEIADGLKEELIQIYESDLTVKSGLIKLKQWLIYARIVFGGVADTLAKHLPLIANYFLNRTTSGVTEGLNTKIKLILRQSYGFPDFVTMREKLLACLFQ
jgi:transposase